MSTEKTPHNLKVEKSVFYLVVFLRTSSLEDSLSDSSEGLFRRGKGGDRIYREFCNKYQIIKRLLLIEENQISQVNEFSALLCMGRCNSPGSLKPFL